MNTKHITNFLDPSPPPLCNRRGIPPRSQHLFRYSTTFLAGCPGPETRQDAPHLPSLARTHRPGRQCRSPILAVVVSTIRSPDLGGSGRSSHQDTCPRIGGPPSKGQPPTYPVCYLSGPLYVGIFYDLSLSLRQSASCPTTRPWPAVPRAENGLMLYRSLLLPIRSRVQYVYAAPAPGSPDWMA